MRIDGRRSKKLRVAFHFQFSNPAAWRCDECRRNRLELKRRCGHVPEALESPPRVVWARGGASTTVCPKAYISGDSSAWLEAFGAWKRLGPTDPRKLSAREAHAMMLLEQELSTEVRRGDE